MPEFTPIEQQMLIKNLTPEQKMLFTTQFASASKDRGTVLILSVLLGWWGIDRFYVGDTGLGLLKLFTFGVCGVMWLVDLFLIRDRADDVNRQKAREILNAIDLTS